MKLKIKYDIFVRFIDTSGSPVKLFRILLLLKKQWFTAVLFLLLSQPELTHNQYICVYISIYLYINIYIHAHKVVFPFAYKHYSENLFGRAKINLVEIFSLFMKILPGELWNIY